jgi:hypothetical protein
MYPAFCCIIKYGFGLTNKASGLIPEAFLLGMIHLETVAKKPLLLLRDESTAFDIGILLRVQVLQNALPRAGNIDFFGGFGLGCNNLKVFLLMIKIVSYELSMCLLTITSYSCII